MQTTYGRGHRGARKRETGNRRGNRQLIQLLVCLGVFFAVFVGKGIWPSEVAKAGEYVLSVLRANGDFRAAFSGLGQALAQQESIVDGLEEFCVAVFAPEQSRQPDRVNDAEPTAPEQGVEQGKDERPTEEQELPAEPPTPTLQVGDVVQETAVRIDLPEGYSGQWLHLGQMPAVTPLMGKVSSPFGYRDHPTKERYAVHGGVDIAAASGTEVAAFADGVAERIGESADFGKYLYLKHENGVTTFYAHCSKVCVKEGEQVQAGQTVARVGSTGQSTGPHLHFEVRLNEVRLDPLHYIDPTGEG